MLKHSKSSGFNLLELIVVLAIMGSMATVAMPNYKNYILRSKINTLLSITATLKLDITAALSSAIKPSAGKTKITSPYASSISILNSASTSKAVIEIIANYAALGLSDTLKLQLIATVNDNNAVQWQCHGTSKYHNILPRNCRNNLKT